MDNSDFRTSKSFKKDFKKRLKSAGMNFTTEQIETIATCFLNTILYDYVYKYKRVVFSNFGWFEGSIFKISRKDGENIIFPRMKFKQSIQIKNEFKRRHQADGETPS